MSCFFLGGGNPKTLRMQAHGECMTLSASASTKADQLGLTIVGEYVEAGRSATEMEKRVAFQQMLQRVRGEKDVD